MYHQSSAAAMVNQADTTIFTKINIEAIVTATRGRIISEVAIIVVRVAI